MSRILALPALALFLLNACSSENTGDGTHESDGEMHPVYPMESMLGVTHTGGKYCLTDTPYLLEGAAAIYDMGFRTIKVFLSKTPSEHFPYNSDWTSVEGKPWREILSHPYFEEMLGMGFSTVVFNITDHGKQMDSLEPDFTEASEDLRDMCAFLLEKYKDRDITFIMKNWEGDWILRGGYKSKEDWLSSPEKYMKTRIANFVKWTECRQAAVSEARNSVTDTKAKVYLAVEANKVVESMLYHVPGVANTVLPNVEVDMVSWSSYDGMSSSATFRQGLEYLKKMHRTTGAFPGNFPVMIGEFGIKENTADFDVDKWLSGCIDVCIELGVPYFIYWEVYCNEPKDGDKDRFYPMRTADEMNGLWLVKPDGTYSKASATLKRYLDKYVK